MDVNIGNIADSFRGLGLAGGTAQPHEQQPLASTPVHPASLHDATQRLIKHADFIAKRVESVKLLAGDATSKRSLSVAEICSLRGGIKTLRTAASNLQCAIDALEEATECSVVKRLTSLGDQNALFCWGNSPVPKLLTHFDKDIRKIARKFLDDASKQDLLWKTAEECYKQAIFGTLHPDNYFVPLEETYLESPYDPDFESEEYYEHENRLDVDLGYAESDRQRILRNIEARDKRKENWTAFWVSVLNSAPFGPTLFYPPASHHLRNLKLREVPRYLFRTFETTAVDTNEEGVIASTASRRRNGEKARVDVLTMDMGEVTELLDGHLNTAPFDEVPSDDFTSWTSSLLYAIQYAIWKCRPNQYSGNPNNVKICAVDTSDFPRGQFAQDICLLNAYYGTAQTISDSAKRFFNLRLQREDYYNGEYLSQGAVNIAGRSSVVSLSDLITARLYSLYSEFADPEGSKQWTNRAKELHKEWSKERSTTDQEIDLALGIARRCFPQIAPVDMANILLAFKKRKYPDSESMDSLLKFRRPPAWADKPVEVRRFWIATEAARSCEEKASRTLRSYPRPTFASVLREIFE
ncbi:hypothetical protein P171DRAFT_422826 [Karstenula rhodostoma CBS 690.94]|uniref:DUF7587 domain-containing protein n=1 Tax=Karstenula rhodostoma CBS 690.94 TaxID=1392251 RepID=A0A9P4P6D0_9PLEO|nr:hypothetical protein P171DRAFT_422826 [Karstenula rhodostoma CBS 690.94]